ncbi:uncharacterized protein LOC142337651 [Convolutriloba macropyga]|uniref:uncharacterized protein LOC142337651 n=1 Tax=Convolutriloba macropyga TaxID=536237 RepID=UPI003F51FB13
MTKLTMFRRKPFIFSTFTRRQMNIFLLIVTSFMLTVSCRSYSAYRPYRREHAPPLTANEVFPTLPYVDLIEQHVQRQRAEEPFLGGIPSTADRVKLMKRFSNCQHDTCTWKHPSWK